MTGVEMGIILVYEGQICFDNAPCTTMNSGNNVAIYVGHILDYRESRLNSKISLVLTATPWSHLNFFWLLHYLHSHFIVDTLPDATLPGVLHLFPVPKPFTLYTMEY